ncbi:hypothetical protein [Streptomyces sp. YGL11-2]|uniref:hypothetical protein n=1 Tax=Streptomyces sp. YGL11-2 TaxID=3414028 RepID=UPI003CE9AAC9
MVDPKHGFRGSAFSGLRLFDVADAFAVGVDGEGEVVWGEQGGVGAWLAKAGERLGEVVTGERARMG